MISKPRSGFVAATRGRTHPETGKPIAANFGRFGPFVLHDGAYANLDSAEDVFTVGLNRAVDLIAQKKAKRVQPRQSRRRAILLAAIRKAAAASR